MWRWGFLRRFGEVRLHTSAVAEKDPLRESRSWGKWYRIAGVASQGTFPVLREPSSVEDEC